MAVATESRRLGADELVRCAKTGITTNQVLRLEEMSHNDNVIFSATDITKAELLNSSTRKGNITTTKIQFICGKSRTIPILLQFTTSIARMLP